MINRKAKQRENALWIPWAHTEFLPWYTRNNPQDLTIPANPNGNRWGEWGINVYTPWYEKWLIDNKPEVKELVEGEEVEVKEPVEGEEVEVLDDSNPGDPPPPPPGHK